MCASIDETLLAAFDALDGPEDDNDNAESQDDVVCEDDNDNAEADNVCEDDNVGPKPKRRRKRKRVECPNRGEDRLVAVLGQRGAGLFLMGVVVAHWALSRGAEVPMRPRNGHLDSPYIFWPVTRWASVVGSEAQTALDPTLAVSSHVASVLDGLHLLIGGSGGIQSSYAEMLAEFGHAALFTCVMLRAAIATAVVSGRQPWLRALNLGVRSNVKLYPWRGEPTRRNISRFRKECNTLPGHRPTPQAKKARVRFVRRLYGCCKRAGSSLIEATCPLHIARFLAATTNYMDKRKEKETSERVIRAYFPDKAHELLDERRNSGVQNPCRTLILIGRTRMDGCMMLMSRRDFEQAFKAGMRLSVNLIVDASPNSGTDLLAVVMDIFIGAGHVVRYAPTLGMGHGFTSLLHKAITLIHSLCRCIGASFEVLQWFFDSVNAIVTDFGTEKGLSEVPNILEYVARSMYAAGRRWGFLFSPESVVGFLFKRAIWIPGSQLFSFI